jgi:3',5'-cyclic AMP phosphodiesterase CpdA
MKIALVSDSHLSPHDRLLAENWRAVDRWIDEAAADLVVHLGDITANGAEDAAELGHAHQAVTRADRDMLFLPGNHDIGDGPGEGGAPFKEASVSPERLAAYRRTFGPDFWSLQAEGWQLVGLNAQLFGAGGEEEARQWRWLEEVLATADGPLGVFCHKPLVPFGAVGADTPTRYPVGAARARLAAVLAPRDLRFVASGHTHQALSFHDGGVEHLWTPSCAFILPEPLQAAVGDKRVGAVLLELGADGHRFSLAEPPGLTRHDVRALAHIYPQVLQLGAPSTNGGVHGDL